MGDHGLLKDGHKDDVCPLIRLFFCVSWITLLYEGRAWTRITGNACGWHRDDLISHVRSHLHAGWHCADAIGVAGIIVCLLWQRDSLHRNDEDTSNEDKHRSNDGENKRIKTCAIHRGSISFLLRPECDHVACADGQTGLGTSDEESLPVTHYSSNGDLAGIGTPGEMDREETWKENRRVRKETWKENGKRTILYNETTILPIISLEISA
jgi:hypothetical protein